MKVQRVGVRKGANEGADFVGILLLVTGVLGERLDPAEGLLAAGHGLRPEPVVHDQGVLTPALLKESECFIPGTPRLIGERPPGGKRVGHVVGCRQFLKRKIGNDF